jgi:hypothetical protein
MSWSVTLITPRSVTVISSRSAIIVPTRGSALALSRIRLARARIGLLAIGFLLRGAGAFGLAGKAALGEFLLRAARRSGTAFAAGRSITPAARRTAVFIVVAGHDKSRCSVS